MHEKTIRRRTVFKGRLLTVEHQIIELEQGVHASREIIRHRGAVAVLGRLPDQRFVLVRQYRKPVEKEMAEAVAGCLEKGELPRHSAIREVGEETGYAVTRLVALGRMYPSPGYCDEVLHLFYAELKPAQTGHRPDVDERVHPVYYSEQQLETMIRSGRMQDAKTIVLWAKYTLWRKHRH